MNIEFIFCLQIQPLVAGKDTHCCAHESYDPMERLCCQGKLF